MKTSQHTLNQIGFQTIKTIVLLVVFVGITFLISSNASISVEKSFADYEQNAEILKILDH